MQNLIVIATKKLVHSLVVFVSHYHIYLKYFDFLLMRSLGLHEKYARACVKAKDSKQPARHISL